MPRAREDWTGIHAHNGGWRAVVSRGSSLPRLKKWYPKGTPCAVMQKWRLVETSKWNVTRQTFQRSGTFRADCARYLKHPDILKLPSYKEREPQLNRWIQEFGDTPRDLITSAQIRKIRDRWATDARSTIDSRPLSAGRVNRLMATLSNLWTILDGRGAPNPCRGIAPLTESMGPVRDIPKAELDKILTALSDRGKPVPGGGWPKGSKTRARILVLAATGLPNSTLGKLRPEDVDLRNRLIYRPARNKGSGVEASAQPITKAAVDAFKLFIKLDCWGPFSRSSLRKSFVLAAKKAGITRPIRPYDLRHTFLTQLAKASGDEAAIMDIAQHSKISTTRRYTRGSMSHRALAAVKAYEAAQRPQKRRKRA